MGAGSYPGCAISLPGLLVAHESNRGWPRALGSCALTRDPKETSSSCLQINSALVNTGHLGSDQLDGRSLSLYPLLSVDLSSH